MESKALPLVGSDSPILKRKLATFAFEAPPQDPIEIARILSESLLTHGGVGLAANQIGLEHRVFAIKAKEMLVCFNPRIVDVSTKQDYLDEGCLTFPGLFIKIKRPTHIKVRFQYPNGETVTETYTGITSRIFQHELDHLDGILFQERANPIHLEQARNKLRRLKKYGGK